MATAMTLAAWIVCTSQPWSARGEDASAPAFLQIFEARWETIENRLADIHNVGYGRLWLPPPERADSGNLSVGYDVYDRFDLGQPRNETLYGTETSLKTLVRGAHSAGVLVNTDFIPNHDGFSDLSTVDTRGTPSTADDVTFVQAGDYPGFVVTLPGDVDGDFHGAFETGEQNFRLSGLIDIAQEKNHQFIRHPTTAGNPQNIPAGTQGAFGRPIADVPNANNARFYPDQGLGGTPAFDPALNQNVTLYDFNTATPLAGDPFAENALGLLMRNARWMIQEIGVDGFRIDAARHTPTDAQGNRWVLQYLDQAMFRAKTEPLLDGSPQHTFTFSETGGDGDATFMQKFIRDDINNANLGQLGGNRDALDFKLFYAMKDNLTSNGFANNWHHIRGAGADLFDDGLRNGSQGVGFAQSHDELGPFLQNVAYAHMLMLPGNAIVYTNAKEFGNGRDFPRGGKDDALGGFYGETITKLVDIRNSHGRGNFHERWIDEAFGDGNGNGQQESAIYVYERSKSAIVGMSNRNDSFVETRNNVRTNFDVGTVLVELTGNAADSTVDPGNVIPQAVRVYLGPPDQNNVRHHEINLSIPSNAGHGRGYVIYGVAPPQGTLSLTNIASTLAGATPTAANNGTSRLAGIDVITANTFNVQLGTTPVTLPAPAGESNPVRDVHADGDTAMLRIDGGLNLNNLPGVDHVTPGSVDYGFEEFTTTRSPGYVYSGGANVGTGVGAYTQTIDTTQLAEGRHYITVRAFRHRNAATGGDGGPAVFTDFHKTIYVDRLDPLAAVVSFAPFASSPGTLQNRDLIVRSTDGTADNMHFFLDLPANVSDAAIMQMVNNGQGDADDYDRDSFVRGYFGVRKGNHVATVVTIEPTGNTNIQRFAGLFTTGLGAGFGDLTGNGLLTTNDIIGTNNGSFEQVLYSQNSLFNAAADLDADGKVTNLDLLALGPHLISVGASAATLNAYDQLLVKRGDLNLDRVVDGADFLAWQRGLGHEGVAGASDLEIFRRTYGRTVTIAATAAAAAIPEPSAAMLIGIAAAVALTHIRHGCTRRHVNV